MKDKNFEELKNMISVNFEQKSDRYAICTKCNRRVELKDLIRHFRKHKLDSLIDRYFLLSASLCVISLIALFISYAIYGDTAVPYWANVALLIILGNFISSFLVFLFREIITEV